MLFNSLQFAVFFISILLIFPVIPGKFRSAYLLAVSLIFYMSWNVKYVFLICSSILITYVCGILIGNTKNNISNRKKCIVAVGFVVNILILALFKYFNFFIININKVLSVLSLPEVDVRFNVMLPVGISFYTFQALGYIIDVYRGKIEYEKNIIKYALFITFFPMLIAGPIERSSNIFKQIDELSQRKAYKYEEIISGLILMLWGYFLKMVVADRAAILVNNVYDSYWDYGFFGLSIATCLFAVQIYCDFASYSTIAIGASRILGFRIMENFNAPYFSRSVGEFWRRWHISLSTWLRDYLYIPLGGSRCSLARTNFNIVIVMIVSGLWHGAGLSFIAWGALWAVFMVISNVTKKIRSSVIEKLKVNKYCLSFKFGQVLLTIFLTCFAWIFFRAPSLTIALKIVKRIVVERDFWSIFNGQIYDLGLSCLEFNILFLGIALVFLVDIIRYKKNKTIDAFLLEQNLWFQWVFVIVMLMFIFIYGIYGLGIDSQQFIYFQF